VSVNITSSGKALVIVSASIFVNPGPGSCGMSWATTGANATAASDSQALFVSSANGQTYRVSATALATGLTAGSTTFTAKYRSPNGVACNFNSREIVVIPF